MKTSLAVVGVVLCWAVTTAFTQVSVAGMWTLEMRWPGSTSTGVCTFEQGGDDLRGTCGSDADRFPITGRVTDRKLSWRVDVTQGGAAGRLEFDGEIDARGTTITGSCSVGDQFGRFTMTRR